MKEDWPQLLSDEQCLKNIKKYCVLCRVKMNLTVKQYRQKGNICSKCNSRASRVDENKYAKVGGKFVYTVVDGKQTKVESPLSVRQARADDEFIDRIIQVHHAKKSSIDKAILKSKMGAAMEKAVSIGY